MSVLAWAIISVLLVVAIGFGINSWATNWHESILREVGIVSWSDETVEVEVEPVEVPHTPKPVAHYPTLVSDPASS